MTTPETAAGRTRLVKRALNEGGYTEKVDTVRSDSASHRSRTTAVFGDALVFGEMAIYLGKYLADVADVEACTYHVSVHWK